MEVVAWIIVEMTLAVDGVRLELTAAVANTAVVIIVASAPGGVALVMDVISEARLKGPTRERERAPGMAMASEAFATPWRSRDFEPMPAITNARLMMAGPVASRLRAPGVVVATETKRGPGRERVRAPGLASATARVVGPCLERVFAPVARSKGERAAGPWRERVLAPG